MATNKTIVLAIIDHTTTQKKIHIAKPTVHFFYCFPKIFYYLCKNFAKVILFLQSMLKIGVLSDTHGFINDKIYTFFADCDELWHAGDIGVGVLDTLRQFKPVVAVYGNTDDWTMRTILPETQLFLRDGLKIIMTHIGGYPGHYERRLYPIFQNEKPDIFVAGHSHILRVMYDKSFNMLHINPGAAGRQGFQKVSTLVRFTIDGKPKDLEIMEL